MCKYPRWKVASTVASQQQCPGFESMGPEAFFCVEFGFSTGTQVPSHSPKTYVWVSGELVTLNWLEVHRWAWMIVCLVCYSCHEPASRPGCTLPLWFNFKVDWKALQPDCFLMPLYPETGQLIGFQLGFVFFLSFSVLHRRTKLDIGGADGGEDIYCTYVTSSKKKKNPVKSTTSLVAQQNRKTRCFF